uniref:HDC14523 n=1 Tax=Drosophila melanogaster TaxID=7227 RepID=Q6IJN9_DROME|nr:TPA_inf: HDC14523 [Drosophila melanogaster]
MAFVIFWLWPSGQRQETPGDEEAGQTLATPAPSPVGNHHPPATTTYACHPFAICHCPLPPHPIYSSVCENAIKSLKLQLQLLLHLQLKSPATPKEKAVATKSVN